MRTLNRNKRLFYYANYQGKTLAQDSDHNYTGEYTISYDNPIKCFGNISASRGDISVDLFGSNLNYDKAIALSSDAIGENAILWVDKMPIIANDGTTSTPHDYIVVRKATSLNHTIYAIRRVEVK